MIVLDHAAATQLSASFADLNVEYVVLPEYLSDASEPAHWHAVLDGMHGVIVALGMPDAVLAKLPQGSVFLARFGHNADPKDVAITICGLVEDGVLRNSDLSLD